MSNLKLKKEFSKGVTTMRVDGFGTVNFDPDKVDPKDYGIYQKRGFDIFEEVKGSQPDNPEMTEREAALDEANNLAAIKKMAKDLDLKPVKDSKKLAIIKLIIEEQDRRAAEGGEVDNTENEEEEGEE